MVETVKPNTSQTNNNEKIDVNFTLGDEPIIREQNIEAIIRTVQSQIKARDIDVNSAEITLKHSLGHDQQTLKMTFDLKNSSISAEEFKNMNFDIANPDIEKFKDSIKFSSEGLEKDTKWRITQDLSKKLLPESTSDIKVDEAKTISMFDFVTDFIKTKAAALGNDISDRTKQTAENIKGMSLDVALKAVIIASEIFNLDSTKSKDKSDVADIVSDISKKDVNEEPSVKQSKSTGRGK